MKSSQNHPKQPEEQYIHCLHVQSKEAPTSAIHHSAPTFCKKNTQKKALHIYRQDAAAAAPRKWCPSLCPQTNQLNSQNQTCGALAEDLLIFGWGCFEIKP